MASVGTALLRCVDPIGAVQLHLAVAGIAPFGFSPPHSSVPLFRSSPQASYGRSPALQLVEPRLQLVKLGPEPDVLLFQGRFVSCRGIPLRQFVDADSRIACCVVQVLLIGTSSRWLPRFLSFARFHTLVMVTRLAVGICLISAILPSSVALTVTSII